MTDGGQRCQWGEAGSRAEIIMPSRFELPFISVVEDPATGLAQAGFALKLSGVRYSGESEIRTVAKRNSSSSMRYVSSLLDGLTGSQALEVVCGVSRMPGKATKNEWMLLGTASGGERQKCIDEASDLYESVNVVLKTMRSEYQFATLRDTRDLDDDASPCPCTVMLEPETLTVSVADHRSIGFISERTEASGGWSVTLPMTPGKPHRKYLDSVYCGAAGNLGGIRLSIGIQAVVLDDDERMAIDDLLKAMRSGQRLRMISGGNDDEIDDQARLARIVVLLEPWARDPYGYRIRCRVDSDRPLPASLLSMIGTDVFHDGRIYSRYEDNDAVGQGDGAEERGARSLDLAGCLHRSSSHIPLFPSAKVLSETGFKREYCASVPACASDGILLGRCGSDIRAESVFYPRDDRAKHCYIIGASGTGKSTLLYNMIMQDIVNGEGVTLIDPHGDLYTDVLGSVPKERYGDVVLVNPCDFEYATGINFLETSNSRYRSVEMNFIINEMMCIFDRLYDLRTTGGPIFEQYMRNALSLIMDADPENGTLMDVPLVFEDRDFRKGLLEKCRNQTVKNFWIKQALQAGGDVALTNVAPYITSKLNQFTTNALLRPIIGQRKSTINFRTILDEGKVLLVNLSKGLLGQMDTMLLGMLIIGKIFSSAMSRVAVPQELRRQMFLYVDEFQNFTTESVAHLLSESRKFGIALTLANQNLAQLSSGFGRSSILDSVLGNVGTVLMFRTGILDSDRMAHYVRPVYTASDLQELPDYHVISRMLVNNAPQRPFVFNTLPVAAKNTSRDLPEIIDHLRRKYSTPRYEVESQIIARYNFGRE